MLTRLLENLLPHPVLVFFILDALLLVVQLLPLEFLHPALDLLLLLFVLNLEPLDLLLPEFPCLCQFILSELFLLLNVFSQLLLLVLQNLVSFFLQ